MDPYVCVGCEETKRNIVYRETVLLFSLTFVVLMHGCHENARFLAVVHGKIYETKRRIVVLRDGGVFLSSYDVDTDAWSRGECTVSLRRMHGGP